MAQPDETYLDRVDPVAEETQHLARLAVCARATDATEAKGLLDMLGLTEGARKSVRHRGIGDRVMIPAGPARQRLKELRKLGAMWLEISAETGISVTSLRAIDAGRVKSVRRNTEEAILAVTGIGEAGAA